MKYLTLVVIAALALVASSQFCRASGKSILDVNGRDFFIKGIGIGNWLNPEGYMLGLDKVSSYRTIDTAFSELLDQKGAIDFWKEFRAAYMTAEDFQYIKKVGFNTVRLPFNYKLFIDELNPGTYRQEGFDLLNFAITQCKLVYLWSIVE